MKIYRNLSSLQRNLFDQCVLTIGKFDGIHLGHQKLLHHVIEYSKNHDIPSVVFIFYPSPVDYFSSWKTSQRVSTFRDNMQQLKKIGIDNVVLIRFNDDIVYLTAKEFVEKILIEKVKLSCLVVGYDFHFGHNRLGNIDTLLTYSKKGLFQLSCVSACRLSQEIVSSSLIKKYLKQRQLDKVNQLLGYNYYVSGKVIVGQKLGRQLGFPTANILLKHDMILRGVFAVQVQLEGNDELYYGIANLGYKPTFNGQKLQLEVHIFNFSATIYTRHLSVKFVKWIRNEMKFLSIVQLQAQIKKDVDSVLHFFQL